MLELIVLSAAVIGNLALAILVSAKNPRKPVNRNFAFFAVSFAVWAVINYISLHPVLFDQLFWIRLVMVTVAFQCMYLLLLANVFPANVPFYRGLNKFVVLPGIIIAVLALSPWLFTGVNYDSGSPQPEPGPAMLLFVPYVVTTIILSPIILIRRFLHSTGRTKEHIRLALIGIVLTFAMLFITNFIVVLVFRNSSLVAFSPILSLIFTASFAYGMIRRQLFDVRLIVARFVAYLLLLIVAGGIYGSLTVALSFFVLGIQPSVIQVLASTAIVGVLILFVQPLRQFLNRITRAIFYQDAYDTKNVLDRLAAVLVRSTNTDVVANNSMSILQEALKSEYITMILIDKTPQNEPRFIRVGEAKDGLSRITSLKFLADAPRIIVVDSVEKPTDRVHARLEEADVSVVARLEALGEVIGYCFFGYKTSGSAYSQQDIDLIRIACDEFAVAMQNALRFEQIQAFNSTLQQRIEEATKELRTNNAQLQRLDEAKDEFVSMASHQLRTPLTSVKGYISMVLEGDMGKITPTQRQVLGEAYTSSERMVHLINDFLNVSRLQTGKFMLELHAVDLSKIVVKEVESLQTTAKSRDLSIVYRKPSYFPTLYLDEGKIRQVLMNFIDNAIYYSHSGMKIEVKLEVVGGEVVVTVRDEGIGVPKEEQVHLFSKFFRASNARKQRPDGTGVGLFLAKKVVVAHGGKIIFESAEGKGSVFGFRLPIKKLSVRPKDDSDKLDN
jgi:signal transduction histidine kinase